MSTSSDAAAWVQASCSLAALVGLTWYTIETWKIRKAAIEQSAAATEQSRVATVQIRLAIEQAQASRRPFLELKLKREEDDDHEVFYAKNTGVGPAIDVVWVPAKIEGAQPAFLGDMGVQSERKLACNGHVLNVDNLVWNGAILVLYKDIGGEDYMQLVDFVGNRDVRIVVIGEEIQKEFPDKAPSVIRAGKDKGWMEAH